MNHSDTIGKITAAICAVVAERGYVKADAKNDHFNYSYLSDEAVLGHVRGSMAENGLALIPSGVEYVIVPNGKGDITTTTTTYTLAHASGEWMQVQVVAQGQDKSDKGPYKAATGALKYALRQVFLIPTGNDPEKAAKAERKAQAKALGIDEKGHTAFWRAHSKGVCAAMGEQGTTYNEIAEWTESLGRGRPSGWPEDRVRGFVAKLKDGEVRQAFEDWRKAKGGDQ